MHGQESLCLPGKVEPAAGVARGAVWAGGRRRHDGARIGPCAGRRMAGPLGVQPCRCAACRCPTAPADAPLPLQQRAEQACRRPTVAMRLDEAIEDVTLVIDGTPERAPLALDGDRSDLLVHPRRDGRAAQRCFRTRLKSQRQAPCRLVPDTRGRSPRGPRGTSCPVSPTTRPKTLNKRAEGSQQPPRPNRSVRCAVSPHLPTPSGSCTVTGSCRSWFAWVGPCAGRCSIGCGAHDHSPCGPR